MNWLTAIRSEAGLSMDELARLSGISKPRIFGIEHETRSNVTLDTIRKLAKAFNVPPTYIAAAALEWVYKNESNAD